MFKGPDDNVAGVSPLSRQQSRLPHSSWAMLPHCRHAAGLRETPGEAFQLPPKSEYTHPHRHRLTPVRLPCVIMGKEPKRNSRTMRTSRCLWLLCPFTDLHLHPETHNWSGSSPWAIYNASEISYLQRKHTDRKGNPPIFCHTFHCGHFLDPAATLLYKTFPTEKRKAGFSFNTSHVLHCTKLVLLCVYI